MLVAKRCKSCQFLFVPDPPTGVMRRAEQQNFFIARQLCFKLLKIHVIATITPHQRRFQHLTTIRFDNPRKSMINRAENNHAITSRTQRLQAYTDRVAQSMRINDPVWLDMPIMAALHPAGQGLPVICIITKIAMDPMNGGIADHIIHRWRRRKIHIRHPHGDTGFWRHPVFCPHGVPF